MHVLLCRCVVVPAIDEPSPQVVRCMRRDLLQPASFFDSPVWSDSSSDNMFWHCHVWQVDNPCSTFIAGRDDHQPATDRAVSPIY